MKRWLYALGAAVIISIVTVVAAAMLARPESGGDAPRKQDEKRLTVKILPHGPSQETIDDAARNLAGNRSVSEALGRANSYRLLSFEVLDPGVKNSFGSAPPNRFLATYYDYVANNAVYVEGSFNRPDDVQIKEANDQPLPSGEEFRAAVDILRADRKLGALIEAKSYRIYEPMPPTLEARDGERVERTVNVGLWPSNGRVEHEIVGVNMIRGTVVRYPNRAPTASEANHHGCGLPNAFQSVTPRGTAGQYQLTISEGGTELWRMLVIRPSVSSGTRGSGVELRDVSFRGRSVFKRAHVPILNVQYTEGSCGPYRDWQYSEEYFQADGTDVAPGIRLADTPPTTVIDTGNDFGNFRGVAVYNSGREVTLISELNASWYRYISEWRFSDSGKISPRFGFGGVENSCVCNAHNHHAFWRFDFDVVSAENNSVLESLPQKYDLLSANPPGPILGNVLSTERKLIRNPTETRAWYVRHNPTGAAYAIRSGAEDNVADSYARGDLWFLRYYANQLDDGVNSTNINTEARLDNFVNGESIDDQDVVVWYHAAYIHDQNDTHSATQRATDGQRPVIFEESRLGPDLFPVSWGTP